MSSQPGVNSNPPTTSINEILTNLAFGMVNSDNAFKRQDIEQTKTALYTLIASVRPEDKWVAPLPDDSIRKEDIAWDNGYNNALQDYDNAIKDLLHE